MARFGSDAPALTGIVIGDVYVARHFARARITVIASVR